MSSINKVRTKTYLTDSPEGINNVMNEVNKFLDYCCDSNATVQTNTVGCSTGFTFIAVITYHIMEE